MLPDTVVFSPRLYTVQHIHKEGKTTTDEKLKSPEKTRKRADYHKVVINNFDRRVIVDLKRGFYVLKKVVPTCKNLYQF